MLNRYMSNTSNEIEENNYDCIAVGAVLSGLYAAYNFLSFSSSNNNNNNNNNNRSVQYLF